MNTRNHLLTGAAALSIALAGCASSPGYSDYGSPGSSGTPASCYDCGTVTRIEQVGTETRGTTGAVLGGVVGAAAGRELADDESSGKRTAATVAGAAAGALAGRAIERNVRGVRYDIHVRMDDGRTVTVTQDDLGGIREGSYVRVRDGRATLR